MSDDVRKFNGTPIQRHEWEEQGMVVVAGQEETVVAYEDEQLVLEGELDDDVHDRVVSVRMPSLPPMYYVAIGSEVDGLADDTSYRLKG